MKMGNKVLTKRERDILILCVKHLGYKRLSNAEIAEHLGLSVSCVKTSIHRAGTKLGAHSRIQTVLTALIKGEIHMDEISSPDEIAEIISSLDPNMQTRIVHLMRQWLEHSHLQLEEVTNIRRDISRDTLLTNAERVVVVLLGHGLTNNEIANRLCISTSAVRTFIYRACTKLGVSTRADVIRMARIRGEIDVLDLISPNKMIRIFIAMKASTIEKVIELLDNRLEQKAIKTGG